MTLALDPQNRRSARRSPQASVVPPAAVWDIRPGDSYTSRYSHPASSVRTLRIGEARSNRTELPGVQKSSNRVNQRRTSSNIGNYLLGAVFGGAVFFGIVAAGLGGASEPADVPATGASVGAVVSADVH